jgi:hypothetical protein
VEITALSLFIAMPVLLVVVGLLLVRTVEHIISGVRAEEEDQRPDLHR